MSEWYTDQDAEDLQFSTDDVDESAVGSAIVVDQVGKYHLEIADAKNRFETMSDNGNPRRPDILCTCRVLNTVKGQSPEGSVYYHQIQLGGKGGGAPEKWQKESTVNFLHGIGLLKKVDGKFIDPETGTTAINVKTLAKRLQGIQFIGHIKRNKSNDERYDDKFELLFGRGAFQVNDPAVANVPKNADALALIGGQHQRPQQATAPAPSNNGTAADYDDI